MIGIGDGNRRCLPALTGFDFVSPAAIISAASP
jgi:hypothetical protein